ncbi:MAG: exodeoxyribonuclease VII small subunit [bacterium]
MDFKFEDAMKKLEVIVKKFETEEVDLDSSVKLFEDGMKLSVECSKKLDEVEKKIEFITKNKNSPISPFGKGGLKGDL